MVERRKQQRYRPAKYLTVYDFSTGKPLGKLVNMSSEGAMLVTPGPVKESSLLRCCLKLPLQLRGRGEVIFDAECRWCRKNVNADRWESGHQLTMADEDAELVPYLLIGFEVGDWGEKCPVPEVRTIDLANRRDSTRYQFGCTLPVFEKDSYRQIGELADLSTQGVRIISSRPINKGDQLRCRIKLHRKVFQEDFLVFESECRWHRKIEGHLQYESGHRIVTISPRDAAIIMNLIFHDGKVRPTQRKARVVK